MSPRPIEFTVEAFSAYDPDEWYPVEVLDFRGGKKTGTLAVKLRHLARDQIGRTHMALLPYPIHPEGPTADFLRACGLEIQVGSTVSQKQAIGAVIRAKFALVQGSSDYQVVVFATIPKEDSHGKQLSE